MAHPELEKSDLREGSKDVFARQWRDHPTSMTYPAADPQTIWQLFELVKARQIESILPPEGWVLECGCGSAGMSIYLANKGFRAIAIDATLEAIYAARRNYILNASNSARVDFLVCLAQQLPFSNGQFDVVMSHGLLEHFEDPTPVLREMSRVMKTLGHFIADIAHGGLSLRKISGFINFVVLSLYWIITVRPKKLRYALNCIKPPYYESRLGRREYADAMLRSGLSNVRISMIRPFPVLPLPKGLERWYVRMIEKYLMAFWEWFDRTEHWMKAPFHSIYLAVAVKKSAQMY